MYLIRVWKAQYPCGGFLNLDPGFVPGEGKHLENPLPQNPMDFDGKEMALLGGFCMGPPLQKKEQWKFTKKKLAQHLLFEAFGGQNPRLGFGGLDLSEWFGLDWV